MNNNDPSRNLAFKWGPDHPKLDHGDYAFEIKHKATA